MTVRVSYLCFRSWLPTRALLHGVVRMDLLPWRSGAHTHANQDKPGGVTIAVTARSLWESVRYVRSV